MPLVQCSWNVLHLEGNVLVALELEEEHVTNVGLLSLDSHHQDAPVSGKCKLSQLDGNYKL